MIALPVETARAEELDDVELLRAAADGDPRAATALFKRFHNVVLAFLSRMVGRDDSDLDDLVQATFLSALDAAERFEGRSQVKTWLLGIAANKARTHLRSAGRSRTTLVAVIDDTASGLRSPSGEVARRQLLERVSEAVDKLTARERATFLLCDVEGIGGADAAVTLGVPQGTMWRRLHDARAKLRKTLGDGR